MQRHHLFKTGLLVLTCILAGCVSAQQVRENRIRDNQDLFNGFDSAIQTNIRAGQIDIGYTEDMVEMAWGFPDRVYMRTTQQGTVKVWSYSLYQPRIHSERMSVPVRYFDRDGRRRIEYHNVWINRDTGEEYAVARVEFKDNLVSAIEQLIQ